MDLEPLATYVVGWVAVLLLVLAIAALLCCLFVADPPRRSRDRGKWSGCRRCAGERTDHLHTRNGGGLP